MFSTHRSVRVRSACELRGVQKLSSSSATCKLNPMILETTILLCMVWISSETMFPADLQHKNFETARVVFLVLSCFVVFLVLSLES